MIKIGCIHRPMRLDEVEKVGRKKEKPHRYTLHVVCGKLMKRNKLFVGNNVEQNALYLSARAFILWGIVTRRAIGMREKHALVYSSIYTRYHYNNSDVIVFSQHTQNAHRANDNESSLSRGKATMHAHIGRTQFPSCSHVHEDPARRGAARTQHTAHSTQHTPRWHCTIVACIRRHREHKCSRAPPYTLCTLAVFKFSFSNTSVALHRFCLLIEFQKRWKVPMHVSFRMFLISQVTTRVLLTKRRKINSKI